MTKFSKATYEETARIISKALLEADDGKDAYFILFGIIDEFNDLFADDNPRFDPLLFTETCYGKRTNSDKEGN